MFCILEKYFAEYKKNHSEIIKYIFKNWRFIGQPWKIPILSRPRTSIFPKKFSVSPNSLEIFKSAGKLLQNEALRDRKKIKINLREFKINLRIYL